MKGIQPYKEKTHVWKLLKHNPETQNWLKLKEKVINFFTIWDSLCWTKYYINIVFTSSHTESFHLGNCAKIDHEFMVDSLKNGAWQGILFTELSTPWIRFLRHDLQFSHPFCVVKSIHSEFVVALFMILQWVYYPSFSMNIVITNYIYAFSTNL